MISQSATEKEIQNILSGATPPAKAGTADSAENVTDSVGGKPLADIFETDGTTVKEATHAEQADEDGDGNNIANTYAKKTEIPDVPDIPTPSASDNGDLLGVSNGAYALIDPSSLTVGNATNAVHATGADSATSATNAVNATNDGNGDNIVNTYVKKSALKYQHNMLLTKTDETSVVFSVLLPSASVYTSITQFCSDMFASYGVQMVNASGYWSGNNVITSFWTSSASTFGTNYEGGTSASQAASSYTIETDHVVALTT